MKRKFKKGLEDSDETHLRKMKTVNRKERESEENREENSEDNSEEEGEDKRVERTVIRNMKRNMQKQVIPPPDPQTPIARGAPIGILLRPREDLLEGPEALRPTKALKAQLAILPDR